MDRATRIAMLARLYVLLGRHRELMTTNTADKIDRVMHAPIPFNCVDRTLIMGATEIDRVCAHSVILLRRTMNKPLLDGLGVMDPDRIVACCYALPDSRRKQVRKDAAWSYHLDHMPEGMDALLNVDKGWLDELDRFVADRERATTNLPAATRRNRADDVERLVHLQEVAEMAVGMTQADLEWMEQSERTAASYMDCVRQIGEELDDLPDRDDPDVQDEVFDRVTKRVLGWPA